MLHRATVSAARRAGRGVWTHTARRVALNEGTSLSRCFSDEAEDQPKVDPAQRRREVRDQATRMKEYEAAVNARRVQYAQQYADEQAAIARQQAEEQRLLEEAVAARAEIRRQRVAENKARAEALAEAQRERRRLLKLNKGIERVEVEKLLQARREAKIASVAAEAGNFIRSFEDVSAAVDAALDSDTRTPWNKLFQK